MKKHFPGFYTYTPQELRDLISKSTIVFGASVLLDLLKISYGNDFLNVISKEIPKVSHHFSVRSFKI